MARNGLAKSEPYLWRGQYMMFEGKFVHRSVWEAHFGPVPDGYVVHHMNGDRLDNRLDNLGLMTRGDHIRLHNPRLGTAGRTPTATVCVVCGQMRNAVEIASDRTRRKCNRCRGKENAERQRMYA